MFDQSVERLARFEVGEFKLKLELMDHLGRKSKLPFLKTIDGQHGTKHSDINNAA
jgi:hypothetical protein